MVKDATTSPAGSAELLQPGHAKGPHTVPVDRPLPGRVLLVRDVVTAARVLEAQPALPHPSADLRLPARDPALRALRRQVVERVVRSGRLRKVILLYHEASPGRSIFSSARLLGSTPSALKKSKGDRCGLVNPAHAGPIKVLPAC